MIECDREIRAAMARGALRITPPPPLDRYSSTAVDLTLGPELRKWKEAKKGGLRQKIHLNDPDFDVNRILDECTERFKIPEGGYELEPDNTQFVLGWTAEKIQLPYRSRIAARVEGKSSLARLGLGIHVTAPTIHAGFGYKQDDPDYVGTELQLEIWNVGKFPIVLSPGIAICQLIFELVDGTPDKGYEGQFTSQGPQIM
jgi:dCTP deaminase